MLGVRDAEFRNSVSLSRKFLTGCLLKPSAAMLNQLFVVSNVEPDSHGGSRLVLNVVKAR
jgi:hypothetical protein